MDKTQRPSLSSDDYWRQRYWDILEQNKKLREELESVKSQLSTALSDLESLRSQQPSELSQTIRPSNPLTTLELSHSTHMEDMLQVLCTSRNSLKLSLSAHFSSRNGKSGVWDTLSQRTLGLDLRESLFPIPSLGEKEEDTIEVEDSQSESERMYEEFMVLGVKSNTTEPEVLLQFPDRQFGRDS